MTTEAVPFEHEIEPDSHDLVGILSAVEETAYTWDLVTDKIEWETNVAGVLQLARNTDVATGTAFQLLIAVVEGLAQALGEKLAH